MEGLSVHPQSMHESPSSLYSPVQSAFCCLHPLLPQDVFPPNIYYKIFTYRHIVDLCAFSPRDYTSLDLRRPLPSSVHNKGENKAVKCVKGGAEGTCEGTDNWYKRWENNGWRMVPSRVSEEEGEGRL